MTRNLFGTLALAALAAFSVSTAAAQELIQIGDDGALEVPVREGSDERVALTPVLIEKLRLRRRREATTRVRSDGQR